MLTKKTLLRVMQQRIAYGEYGPHSIIGPEPMERRRQTPQESFPPGTVFRLWNDRIGATVFAITPYVGEEIKD